MSDETEYTCPQEGCGRDASHVEDGYFQCRCGWFGEPITIIDDLKTEVKQLRARLNDAQDLLENCGYCRECFWDKESISDIVLQLTEPVWPDDCTALCDSCMKDIKEMIE